MTDAKRSKPWSYSTGERGRNRVRAFAHATTGRVFLEYYEQVGRGLKPKICRVGLGVCDRDRAKAAAEELAARLRRAEAPTREHATLGVLFDNYAKEVTPDKSLGKQKHDRACAQGPVRVRRLERARIRSLSATFGPTRRPCATRSRSGSRLGNPGRPDFSEFTHEFTHRASHTDTTRPRTSP